MKNGYIRRKELELATAALGGRDTKGMEDVKSRLLPRLGADMTAYLRAEVGGMNIATRYAVGEGEELSRFDDRELAKELARLVRSRFTDGAVSTFLCELVNSPPDGAAGERDVSPAAVVRPLWLYFHRLRFSDPGMEGERSKCVSSLDRMLRLMQTRSAMVERDDADMESPEITPVFPLKVDGKVLHKASWAPGQTIRVDLVQRDLPEVAERLEASAEEMTRQKEVLLLELRGDSSVSIASTETDKTIIRALRRMDKEDEIRGIERPPHIRRLYGPPGLERMFAELAARRESSMYVQITHRVDKRKMLLLGLASLEERGERGPQDVKRVVDMMFLRILAHADDLQWLTFDNGSRSETSEKENRTPRDIIGELMASTYFEDIDFGDQLKGSLDRADDNSTTLRAEGNNVLGVKERPDMLQKGVLLHMDKPESRSAIGRLMVGRGLGSMYDSMVHRGRGGSYKSHLTKIITMLSSTPYSLLTTSNNGKKIALTDRGRELMRLRAERWMEEWHQYEIVFVQTPEPPKRKRSTRVDNIK